MKKILTDLFNGKLIFGNTNAFTSGANFKIRDKNLNVSAKIDKNTKQSNSFSVHDIKKSNRSESYNNDRTNFIAPSGYVYLRLIRINMEELASAHKMSLDYLRAGGDIYIKNIILNKSGKIINVYHNGENKIIEIIKLTDQDLQITLEEWNGKVEEYQVHNGTLV